MRSSCRSRQLKKAHVQQRRPSAAKKERKKSTKDDLRQFEFPYLRHPNLYNHV